MNGLSMDLVPGSPPVLHAPGDLDMANAEEFGAELKRAHAAGGKPNVRVLKLDGREIHRCVVGQQSESSIERNS
jgi:hypothetical protein